jgi:hypothetical protein
MGNRCKFLKKFQQTGLRLLYFMAVLAEISKILSLKNWDKLQNGLVYRSRHHSSNLSKKMPEILSLLMKCFKISWSRVVCLRH